MRHKCFESIQYKKNSLMWRVWNRISYRKVLEEPRSHYICGHFGEDASFLLPLLVLVILVSRAR